jgi:hypothetical protein
MKTTAPSSQEHQRPPSPRPRRPASVSLLAAAGLILSATGIGSAGADQTPAVVAQPATPAPTGPFPPPPPRFEEQAAPVGPPFGTDRATEFRRFTFTAALGPGMLAGPGERSLAMSYQLFRLGVGLNERLALVLGFAGVGTSSVNPRTMSDSWLKQDLWSAGLQVNLVPRLYVRGGMGVGLVSESVGDRTFSGGRGLAVEGAVGWELLQRQHVALAIEANGSHTHYPRESWQTAGLQLSVSLF